MMPGIITPDCERVNIIEGKPDYLRLLWLVRGPEGAVQFLLHASDQTENPIGNPDTWARNWNVRAVDVGYHSRQPMTYATPFENCPYINAPCYYDGSGMRAHEFYNKFLTEGEDALWLALEEDYIYQFRTEKTDAEQEVPAVL